MTQRRPLSPVVLACALLAPFSGPAAAQGFEPNVVSGLSVADGDHGTVVRVEGSQAPTFTQFSLDGPPRVVLDFSRAVLDGPREARGAGSVAAVRADDYRTDRASVVRVTVELAGERTYEIEAEGNALVMRVGGPTGGALLASARADREETERQAREETERLAREEAERLAREEAERQAREETERLAREEAERQAREETERLAREEAERLAREEAERLAREETERLAREEAERQARKETERQAREQAERQAREQAERQAREEAERVAREEAERQAREEAERQAREEAERQAREQAERQAREQAERQAREQAARAPEGHAARRPAEPERQVEHPGELHARLRDPEAVSRGESPGPARQRAAARETLLSLVGFRPEDREGPTRVIVQTDATASYRVNEVSPNLLHLELLNTRVQTRNDLNTLDTSFFQTVVERVEVEEVGLDGGIRIIVHLKESAPYEVKQDEDEIRLEFRAAS